MRFPTALLALLCMVSAASAQLSTGGGIEGQSPGTPPASATGQSTAQSYHGTSTSGNVFFSNGFSVDGSGNLADVSERVIGLQNGAITSSGAAVTVQTSSTLSSTDVYNPQVPPGWFTYDGVRSSVLVPPGSNMINAEAFGYYIRNQTAAAGLGGNAVGLFGVMSCEVDNAACWGLNPTLTDERFNTGGVQPGVGRILVGAEFDISAQSTGTIIQGVALLGSSYAQPLGADGFTCGDLGAGAIPHVVKWLNCFVVDAGVTQTAMFIGPVAVSGTNVPSAALEFSYFNGSGVGTNINVLANSDAIYIQGNETVQGILRSNGQSSRTGVTGSFGGNLWNFNWTGTELDAWVDSNNIGRIGPNNTLTWVPVYQGSGTAGTSTYLTQTGSYERIGTQISVRFNVSASSFGAASGNLQIGGLPVSSANVSNDYASCTIAYQSGFSPDGGYSTLSGIILPNTNVIVLEESGAAQTTVPTPLNRYSGTVNLVGMCQYHV